ncbi:DUF4129 domain-containing protein [uncultured Nocardioides sp.]|uniref:DUF4129 domain-containing protein n=1 Tax=uncultured Nocardioides sp. TaxID=198441 RepID=UPI00262CD285|nr:DUF4129 domain-containing protein [uncultured Nocardioides sp.]
MTGLDPSGDEGRDLLRRELLRPEYNQENPFLRFLDWLGEQLDEGLRRAGDADPLVVAAALVVLVALALAVLWLVTRARTEGGTRTRGEGVLDDVRASADELRAAAEAALADGRLGEALADAFRALAVRQVERGRLADLPGLTAREVATAVATEHPGRGDALRRAASAFDEVVYGDRSLPAERVRDVLALDDDLAGVR